MDRRCSRRVTLRDVAREAGVAQSTVSHFLNGTAPVSERMRQKILEAVTRLNYRPNVTARNLKKQRTNALGLFVPDITNPFYGELSRGVADVARERGYSVILYATSYEQTLERSFVDLVEQRQVDGVIVSYSFFDENLWGRLLECGIPLVLVDVYPVNTVWPSVVVNNEKGIELALSYLVSLGHSKIAYLSEPPYVLSLVKRQRAFLQFVRKKNLPVKDEWILVEKVQRNRVEIGFELGKKLVGERDIPTAVVASSDLVAVGVVKAFLSSGVRVPEDISVVGFDDILLASYIHPSLTTVRQPKYEMGRIGVEFLVQLIEGKGECPQLTLIEPDLVERNSCLRREVKAETKSTISVI